MFAQSLQDRATSQIEALGPVTGVLTEDALEEVVLPYETDTPFEASLGAEDLEDAVLATRVGNSTASQAFRATVDSATGRPDVAPSDGAFGLANLAVSIGADSVAGLFAGEGTACTDAFDGPITSGTHHCSAPLSRDFRTCREERKVSVNREDIWACSEETPEYRKTCTRPIAWRCTGTTGGACLKSAVTFSRTTQWNASGTTAKIEFIPRGNGTCKIREKTTRISVLDYAELSSLELATLSYQGVAQIQVDGRNLWTQGGHSNADLVIRSRDCGKKCEVDAVYSGNTWIADCGDASHASQIDLELAHLLHQKAPGPNSALDQDPVRALTESKSNRVMLTLVTVNRNEEGPKLRFNVSGACCSEFTASLGDAC